MIYTPKHFLVDEKSIELDFVKENSFATLISSKDCEVSNITKVPLLLKKEGEGLVLEGHMARANPHWKIFEENPKITIIFDGPHDYISPLLYENPNKNVPTWNFSTVIVKGKAKVIDSNEWILNSVMELTEKYEKSSNWSDNVEQSHLDQLSKAIIGISIDIIEIESKFKLSQNRSETDRKNISESLLDSNKELSKLMDL